MPSSLFEDSLLQIKFTVHVELISRYHQHSMRQVSPPVDEGSRVCSSPVGHFFTVNGSTLSPDERDVGRGLVEVLERAPEAVMSSD